MTHDEYSASEVALMLACSPQTILAWVRAGLLAGKAPTKRRRKCRVSEKSLRLFVEANPDKVRWNRPGRMPLPWELAGRHRDPTQSPARHRQWSADDDALLASHADKDVARRVGKTVANVRSRRLYLAQKCGEWTRQRRTYTLEDDAVIRENADSVAAEKLGVTVNAVRLRRRKLGKVNYV